MKVSIVVKGDKEIIRRITNTAIVREELMTANTKSAIVVDKRLKTYPPARPSSSYVRTGRLGKGWGFKVQPYATGTRSFNENPVSYAPDVQSFTEQAKVHRGRWPTDRGTLQEMTQKILGFFTYARDRIAKRLS